MACETPAVTNAVTTPLRCLLCCIILLFTDIIDAKNSPSPSHASEHAMLGTLVAEFSLHREDYTQALDAYFAQSLTQNSPYLARRATRLALYQDRPLLLMQAATRWRNLAPNDAEAYFYCGVGFAYNKKITLALDSMRHAQQLGHPTDFTRIVNIAVRNDIALDQVYESLLIYTAATPTSADLRLAIGLFYQASGNVAASNHHLDKAVTFHGGNSNILELATQVYLRQGNSEGALRAMQQATDLDPYDFNQRLKYAFLASKFDRPLARRQFEFLLTLNPGHGPVVMNLALLNLQDDNYEEARKLLRHQLQINFKPDSAHYYLGQIAISDNNLSDAAHHLTHIQSPREPNKLTLQLIQIETDLHRWRDAEIRVQQMKDRLHQQGTSASVQNRLALLEARLMNKQGKTQYAHDILSYAIQQSPDASLYLQRAALARQLGDHTNQEKDLLAATQDTMPKNDAKVQAMHQLALLFATQGREHDALDLLTKAYQHAPDNTAVLDSLGWVLYRMGQIDQALGLLQDAMARQPNGRVAANLGEILWRIGRKNEATQIFRDALLETPDHEHLQETIKRLNVPLSPPHTA
ncbi:Beta-barrel assembly-enhancing protease [BD1-7 clade bacterium]|uniref:Beta-barrel assembly-enhancing protease n=1 Tax=BD1-7 clade bacterium TaxID=2029982 RepID=A0A5S9MR14_9GAMM|nr:Beta-barrel assembly-enhancing protease [BD1-7 clade bacterium]CAA0084680.1 Beta-barrel assembly-enhancing protease [BD1-7 clade bacterium]